MQEFVRSVKLHMNIFRCLDDIRNGPSKSDKGDDVTQTWFVFLVPGHNPTFAQGKKLIAMTSLRNQFQKRFFVIILYINIYTYR